MGPGEHSLCTELGGEKTSSLVDSEGVWGTGRDFLALESSDIRVPSPWKSKVKAVEKQLRARDRPQLSEFQGQTEASR